MPRKRRTIPQVRGWLYWSAKILGDVDAVLKGRILQRIGRRYAGKYSARGLSWIGKLLSDFLFK